ncbi:uncharacterized protein [Rhodnius prolixus]|uniref:uncharacterized protein n=1 Tax=Rhodnius prolixus TaxID=13249 RepID=UPI003D18F9C4
MGISVLTVNKCCFFLSLETGAKIIGFVYVVLSFIIWTFLVYRSLRWYGPEFYFEEIPLVHVAISLYLIFGLYLVIGTYEKKRTFIMAWLIFNWTMFVYGLYSTLNITMHHGYFSDTFFLIHAALNAHNGIIVYNLYKKLCNKEICQVENRILETESLIEE